VTGLGAAALFVFFSFLPAYIIAVFQIFWAQCRISAHFDGRRRRRVVLVPAIGMGMTFRC